MNRGRRRREYVNFVPLERRILETEAWQCLSPSACKVYIALFSEFKGENNGRICFSIDMGCRNCGLSRTTVAKALLELQKKGFISCVQKGSFDYKIPHASEWRLTHLPSRKPLTGSTNEFFKWKKDKI
jgi:hypothetical protein